MPHLSLGQLGLLLLCYIAYRSISSAWREYQFKKFAKDRGCEEPLNLSPRWPFSVLDGWRRLARLFRLLKAGEDLLDVVFAAQFEKTNTPRVTMFEGSVILSTIEPANIQAMLATQFKDFETGSRRTAPFYPLLGKSIFTSDGAFWEHSRAIFRPQFNREQINDLEETEEATQALIEALGSPNADGWTTAEMQPLLFNFTLDTASSFLFGQSVHSQRLAIKKANGTLEDGESFAGKQFGDDFELASKYMINRLRLQTMYWFSDGFAFRRAISRIRKFTEQFVTKALDPSIREKQTSKKYNLLSALAERVQDGTELRNQTLAILVAGRDTTSGLLGWCFVRLALQPDIFSKLRSVILRDFPEGEAITFTRLKSSRYLQHFLNEVLRLHPNVPANNRVAVRDTTLPVGGGPNFTSPIAVRKGQVVNFSVYLMQRRKDLWGEDALEFTPERWEQRIPPWQFLPFSGGPRICLGQQFALTEASYVLVRMLQHFDAVEPVDRGDMARMRKGLGLTMWPADNVPVRWHRAAGGR